MGDNYLIIIIIIITCLAGDGKRVEKSDLEDGILPRRSTSLFSSLSPSMSFSSPSLAYILPELHLLFFLFSSSSSSFFFFVVFHLQCLLPLSFLILW